jgi:hypothetical protein
MAAQADQLGPEPPPPELDPLADRLVAIGVAGLAMHPARSDIVVAVEEHRHGRPAATMQLEQ